MKSRFLIAGVFSLFVTTQATADATLVFELTDEGGKVTEKQLSIRNFWVRVDDPATSNRYLLYQAGKFFPLYRVDKKSRTFQRLTPEVNPTLHAGLETAKPIEKRPPPLLKPERKKEAVADIPCRIVNELHDGKPFIEHCMANIGSLKITTREIRTLARWLAAAREKELGWIGVGTEDEEFAAIQSREIDGKRDMLLKSVARDPLPQNHLKIPRDFKEIKREAESKEVKETTADKDQPAEKGTAQSDVTPPLTQE